MKDDKKSSEDFLPDCMEQKLILLTRISDITKQIEVRSRQREIDLGDLADRRQVYIGRLKKCQQMIEKACLGLPPEQQARRRKILSGNFPEEECGSDEIRLLRFGKKCGEILRKTLAMDAEARGRLRTECNRLQKLLHHAYRPSDKAYRKRF